MISKSNLTNKNICVVYTHHKLGDLIWQLPYIKAISEHHNCKVNLILRKKTQAQNILKDLDHIENIFYNEFRKGIYYWIDVLKLIKLFKSNNFSHVYILDKVNKPAIAAKLCGVPNAFGVDSFEDYKMWFEENFVELADLLYKKKLFDYIYLICGPDKAHISKKIISLSDEKYFIDCSNKDLTGVITAIKNSDFFVGNNSGPLNLASALGVKSFGLIANDAISELKFSKINFIVPDGYQDNTWIRDRDNMKTLTTEKVFKTLIERLENESK